MKLERCDICGFESEDSYVVITLMKSYQSDEIKDVCKDCELKISEAYRKIRDVLSFTQD